MSWQRHPPSFKFLQKQVSFLPTIKRSSNQFLRSCKIQEKETDAFDLWTNLKAQAGVSLTINSRAVLLILSCCWIILPSWPQAAVELSLPIIKPHPMEAERHLMNDSSLRRNKPDLADSPKLRMNQSEHEFAFVINSRGTAAELPAPLKIYLLWNYL